MTTGRWCSGFVCGALLLAVISVAGTAEEPVEPAKEVQAPVSSVSGSELFNREWIPNDPRSHGGDGLGPVFNDTSCVSCHNQGGAGGGGPASKNVDIVSAFPIGINFEPTQRSPIQNMIRGIFGLQPDVRRVATEKRRARQREKLVKEVKGIHPGFVTSKSVVVHLFGVGDDYDLWRRTILGDGNANFGQFGGPAMHMHDAEEFQTISESLSADSFDEVSVDSIEIAVEGAGEATAVIAASDGPIASTPIAGAEHDHSSRNIGTQSQSAVELQKLANSQATIMQHRGEANFLGNNTNMIGNFTLQVTHRNPTALFGAGIIGQVSDKAIEEAAARKYEGFPEIAGRVCRLPDNKIGRFGWKSQKASLRDFAMTACAVELGLHVPEHTQSGHPVKPDYRPAGYDMNQEECDALVQYLTDLPAPQQVTPAHELQRDYLNEGKALFVTVGCAHCHTESLDQATGLYSDLLLHDMGEELGDTGDYGVFIPDSPGGEADGAVPPLVSIDANPAKSDGSVQQGRQILGATRLEWRTAPLWGVRDSAPYMHDGRAKNIEQAVAFHGGEAVRSSRQYFSLKHDERMKVQAFLRSLTAPSAVASH